MDAAPAPTAVVIGGTGFVGRTLCATLAGAGYRVVIVARTGPPADQAHPFRALDVAAAPRAALCELLTAERPAIVVNAAGALWPVGGRHLTDAQLTDSNHTLVERLVDAVAAVPARPRLIHLGSTYEYGAQPAGALVTEQTVERPVTHYMRTKLASTRAVLDAVGDGRLDATVLRLTTTVGPWAPTGSLFGRVAQGLAASTGVLELPELEGERDFVDVADVADAVVAVAAGGTTEPLYNIASGRITPVAEAVELLIRTARTPVRIRWVPRETHRRDASLVGSQQIDIGRARRLGWRPSRSLTQTLDALWQRVQATEAVAPR